jgi:hypothetical protein
MTYDLFVSGKPVAGVQSNYGDSVEEARIGAPIPVLRRFPPMLQFLTSNSAAVENQLESIAIQAFRDGNDLEHICNEIYNFAMSLGFKATIGMQEVYCSEMPSFPNQTLMTALLMVDLQPLSHSTRMYTQAG